MSFICPITIRAQRPETVERPACVMVQGTEKHNGGDAPAKAGGSV